MIPDGYRILVVYSDEKQAFVATIPELGNTRAEGKTRAEALAVAEAEVESAIKRAAEEGRELPPPLEGTEYSGELSFKVSPSFHRELVFQAAQDGMDLDVLLPELLAAGFGSRMAGRRRAAESTQRDGRPRENRGRGRRPNREQYFNIMEDKASFLDYVRKLEGGGGGGRGGKRGGGRGRGRKS